MTRDAGPFLASRLIAIVAGPDRDELHHLHDHPGPAGDYADFIRTNMIVQGGHARTATAAAEEYRERNG